MPLKLKEIYHTTMLCIHSYRPQEDLFVMNLDTLIEHSIILVKKTETMFMGHVVYYVYGEEQKRSQYG